MKRLFIFITFVLLLTSCSGNVPGPHQVGNDGIGIVSDLDKANNYLTIDICEWITEEDTNRIEALKLDLEMDFPNGFYIYNKSVFNERFLLTNDTKYFIINQRNSTSTETDRDGFISRINEYSVICSIKLLDKIVMEVSEVYVP